MIHELKTWPEYFNAVKSGKKKFEIRKDDRQFHEKDILVLKSYDPDTKEYTGEEISCFVDYVLRGGQFGIQEGFICMSIKLMELKKPRWFHCDIQWFDNSKMDKVFIAYDPDGVLTEEEDEAAFYLLEQKNPEYELEELREFGSGEWFLRSYEEVKNPLL